MKKMLLLMMAVAGCRVADRGLVATGTVEAREYDVAALTAGRIVELRVREGDTVSLGDTVAILTRTELPSQLENARARVEAARSRAQQVERGPREQEIGAARAQLRGAEGDLASAQHELERVRRLVRDSMAAPRELDRAEANFSLARARRDAAAEALALLNAGARAEERAAARAEVQAAQALYEQVRAAAGDLVLTARARGVVQRRNFETGEIANAGQPIVTLLDPQELWVRIYLRQEALASLALGDTVRLEADALPGRRFASTVIEISPRAEFIPRVALTEDERADLVFAVRLRIPASSGLRPGLSVDAQIPKPKSP